MRRITIELHPLSAALVASAILSGALSVASAQCEAELISSAGAVGDFLGRSAAISGNTIMLGGHQLGNGGPGLLCVFENDGDGWIETQKLLPADVLPGDQFGGSVSISGSRAVIGCRLNDEVSSQAGAAYIFDFDGSTWEQTTKLLASDGANNDYFGYSSSLDGDTALVGAYGKNGSGGGLNGGAYIFELVGGEWTETATLTPATPVSRFGREVSIGDGVAVVGAYGSNAVYIYEKVAGSWSETGVINGTPGQFGWAVDSEGGRVVVGAPSMAGTGFVSVIEKVGGVWAEVATLTASDEQVDDEFGASIEILGDQVLVGAPSADASGIDSGAAYLFEFDGSSWSQVKKYVYSQAMGGEIAGNAVGLSATTVVVAMPKIASDTGSAFVVDDPCTLELAALPASVSLGSGGAQSLSIDFGPQFGGAFYWVFGSATGTSPGIVFPTGAVLPLNFDPYFELTLEKPFIAAFENFLGVLAPNGTRSASLQIPSGVDPGLVGVELHHAVTVATTFGIVDATSNAVHVTLVP